MKGNTARALVDDLDQNVGRMLRAPGFDTLIALGDDPQVRRVHRHDVLVRGLGHGAGGTAGKTNPGAEKG